MRLSAIERAGLNVAFNEARLLSTELDVGSGIAAIGLAVLTLPDDSAESYQEASVELRLFPVGRFAAALVSKDGAKASFGTDELPGIVASFGGQPIYGWEFFDPPFANVKKWLDKASLDLRVGEMGLSHTLHVFQDAPTRQLDLCFWFDELELRDVNANVLALDDVIAGGRRWWEAVHANDPRTRPSGIHSLKNSR